MTGINEDTLTGPSFPLRNRLARGVWGVAYAVLFRPSPRPLHFWRRWLLRAFGARVGRGCRIYPRVKVWAPWNVDCGDQVVVGDDANLYSQGKISLGNRAVVSQGSHLCTGTHDYTDPGQPLVTAPITVGARAWVAAECFVLPGVEIGEGCVVGARSVVTRDLPAWMVCAGNPCRPLKPRPRERFGAGGDAGGT